jgi:hypothetical protein
MKAISIVVMALLLGCAEEPERIVGTTTEDGRFELTLEAVRDWVRPGDSLPVQVRLESLRGPLAEALETEIEFVVNNGNVSPSSLTIQFAGADDEVPVGVERVFETWVTFVADSRAGADVQGEIHALFMNVRTTLKIRITPPLDE